VHILSYHLYIHQGNMIAAAPSTANELHKAIYKGSTRTIMHLIRTRPELVHHVTDTEDYPLHSAMKQVPELSVRCINALLDACPYACGERNHYDDLPMHLAAKYSSPELLECLYKRYPEAISMADRHGNLPLHIALKYNRNASAQYLLHVYPQACQVKNQGGCLPLHVAVQVRDNTDMIKSVIDIYPEACAIANDFQRLPLHEALYSQDEEVLSILLARNPNALKHPDNTGYLPLHVLVVSKAQAYEHFTHLMISSYPEACKATNASGELPLHLAAYGLRGCSVKPSQTNNDYLITELIRVYPEGCRVTTTQGFLPLHYAARSNESIEAVKLISQTYPEACITYNMNGVTPYHLFLQTVGKYIHLEKSTLPKLLRIYMNAHPMTAAMKTLAGQEALELLPSFTTKQTEFTRCLYNSYVSNLPTWKSAIRELNYQARENMLSVFAKLVDEMNGSRILFPRMKDPYEAESKVANVWHLFARIPRHLRYWKGCMLAILDNKGMHAQKRNVHMIRKFAEMDCPAGDSYALMNGLLMNVISYL
jgi:ankyrin repeat protein